MNLDGFGLAYPHEGCAIRLDVFAFAGFATNESTYLLIFYSFFLVLVVVVRRMDPCDKMLIRESFRILSVYLLEAKG